MSERSLIIESSLIASQQQRQAGISVIKDCKAIRSRMSKSTERRRRLLDCARTLFVEKGFHQTGMAQIAAESGIATGQIYRDFPSKEAIVAAICEGDLAAWLAEDVLHTAVIAKDFQAIHDWIARFATDVTPFDNRRMMCELLAEIGRNPLIADLNRAANMRLQESLGAALFSLAPNSPEETRNNMIQFIMSLSLGLIAQQELCASPDSASVRQHLLSVLQREVASMISESNAAD